MKHSLTTGLFVGAFCASCTSDSSMPAPELAAPITYPAAARGDVVDDYFGVKVADPYRALEDPDAPATRDWITAENSVTREWIDAVPARAAIEERLTAVWNHARFGVPGKRAGRWFYGKNEGLQNQGVVFTSRSLDLEGVELLDPNKLSADGTAAVGETSASPDGRFYAYQVAEAGSDWNVIRVRDIETRHDLPDSVPWVKFSGIAWAPDSKGFYYSTYPDHDTTGNVALKHHRVLFHELGTDVASDAVVYERPDQPDWGFNAFVSDDGETLFIHQSEGTEQKNRLSYADLRVTPLTFTPLFDRFDAEYTVLGKQGRRVWLRTDKDAPLNRVIALDLGATAVNGFDEIVRESDATLEDALLAGGKLVLVYARDAVNRVQVRELDGRPYDELELPGLGSVGDFRGRLDENEACFSFTTFTRPTSVWRYDVAKKRIALWHEPVVHFAPDDFVTEQIFFSSKDGTKVPMFITRRRDVTLSPSTPTLLYGYGGFNISIKPGFSPAMVVWMERGGAFVSVNLRGGSEYGRAWHEAGTKERKQNVFDDFIGAAEYLIARGWTSREKLAIHGRSNGGLLVGACMTQRPDLFGAAVPGVGVLDMLRYHRFSIGWAWASDYGRSDEADEFPYLLRYSPLHNVKPGVRYPATLVVTGDHDDRVVPAHSFKFAAELQHAQAEIAGAPPVLIRIETRGGHGAGKPTSMLIEEWADILAFLTRALATR